MRPPLKIPAEGWTALHHSSSLSGYGTRQCLPHPVIYPVHLQSRSSVVDHNKPVLFFYPLLSYEKDLLATDFTKFFRFYAVFLSIDVYSEQFLTVSCISTRNNWQVYRLQAAQKDRKEDSKQVCAGVLGQDTTSRNWRYTFHKKRFI